MTCPFAFFSHKIYCISWGRGHSILRSSLMVSCAEQKPIFSKKLIFRCLRKSSLVLPFWYSSCDTISARCTSTTVPNLACRSTRTSAFFSSSTRTRQCLRDTDSSLTTTVLSRLRPTRISFTTPRSITQTIAGSLFSRTTTYSSSYPGLAAKTLLSMRSIRYSAWQTQQVKAFAQAQKTPSFSLSWSMPLRFLIHSTRHSSWMYLADPAQSQTARNGFTLSMVLPQQKRQAGLLSSMEAFACQEQKEQANTLCLSEILGQATCQQ